MSDFCFDRAFQEALLQEIKIVRDYPKKGILFRDITSLLSHGKLFCELIAGLAKRYEKKEIEFVAGIESRGFIFGSALACALHAGFVPIRKKGKLPREVYQREYLLEYGSDVVEIHKDAFCGRQNAKVLLIDDIIATGGTARASVELIAEAGGECLEACFLINFKELNSQANLQTKIFSVLEL
ncbi:adenine phosphoribosyltransferase [Helicobacter mustelae]|uniref:Adenine phosphoribosyltransferase n=1 Tax=Helicobacter mustelae (strain ATCC 43772 / CCUG 25715 / CIP 103759 / LMG 18044 / NCTC 12198 / R85-136P) TaxID=679897 RepID=D3UHD6_HELM1|nr:adenine phosphoribosyltransferase [Helicobacter mustelae]CBG39908.1 adenine phosphoribosyltransferase [Helicobacter mustelae 12198]SQH71419.1 adenine phosphoribosyltransferase [Helicobacter mustelae]